MIFITIGTHPQGFQRLIKRIDEIAPKVKEKIIIQRGFTKYVPKNCESFDFVPDIDVYYKKARLVIAQSATSLIEFAIKYDKPVITVPRQKKYHEHLNDHQVEFADYFSEKTGILAVKDINQITPQLLMKYNKKAKLNKDNLVKLKSYFTLLFKEK